MKVEPVTLTGNTVQLQPLTPALFDALWEVAQHAQIWRYMPFPAKAREDFEAYLNNLLKDEARGRTLPFVTTRLDQAGAVVGSTSFLEINVPNRRLEIGATWITPDHQRSPVNTEAKYLQLEHAFEVLGCNRVEFKTDSLNEKSRAALARIGATEEGTFRNHMVMPDGRLRHSTWFSITREEWPDRKVALSNMLQP